MASSIYTSCACVPSADVSAMIVVSSSPIAPVHVTVSVSADRLATENKTQMHRVKR